MNATDVAAVAGDALVVLVMVWWWIIAPLGWLLVLVLTPWVLAGWGSRAASPTLKTIYVLPGGPPSPS